MNDQIRQKRSFKWKTADLGISGRLWVSSSKGLKKPPSLLPSLHKTAAGAIVLQAASSYKETVESNLTDLKVGKLNFKMLKLMNYVALELPSELRRLFKLLQLNLLHLTVDLISVLGFANHVMFWVSIVKIFK